MSLDIRDIRRILDGRGVESSDELARAIDMILKEFYRDIEILIDSRISESQ